jgi:energy-coupling factor transport system permease protein
MLDARVWLLWALTTLVTASSTRNPLYVVILLLIATVVGSACATGEGRRAPLSPLRFAMISVPLSALFNGLTVHFGDTVLFHLPGWLPLLGGAVTLEALTFGAVNGLTLTAIFSAFAVFNHVTPVRELIKLTPRAFHEGGVVLSIALTFIPQTTRSLQRIREAQAVRGHRVRGIRDWLPIVVPLLISGLERAMGLAEAMVARGYGAVSDEEQTLPIQGLLALGLLTLLGGWLAYLFRPTWRIAAFGVMIVGAGVIGFAIWQTGRGVQHTVYRARRWTVNDTLTAFGCAITLAVALTQRELLYYSPYPRLSLPEFNPFVGMGLLGLLTPAIVATGRKAEEIGSYQ